MKNNRTGKESWRFYALIVAALHLAGVLLLVVAMPRQPFLLGLGFLAYTLGLRHAFDIDHIVAIDNVVRKLIRENKNPTGVGFYFSLGHSTVVFLLSLCAAFVVTWMLRQLPEFMQVGGMIGIVVSGSFLLLIGLSNLFILIDIMKVFVRMRHSKNSPGDLERLLQSRGFFARLVGRWVNVVRKSWHVYPLGFLFGLGLDTASEIAMMTLSQGTEGRGVVLAGVLALPILFAAGMCLMDTADGIFMARNYRWALDNPIRKIYYNLTVTALSVLAALGIGVIELAQALVPDLQEVQLGWMGYTLVILFAAAWGCSYCIWRFGRIEQRWGTENEAQGG